jgi:hypothetical protein
MVGVGVIAFPSTGLGGVGKTQTMIEYAWRHRSDYQVVCWARAGDYDTLTAEFVRIARELGLPEAAFPEQQQGKIRVARVNQTWGSIIRFCGSNAANFCTSHQSHTM